MVEETLNMTGLKPLDDTQYNLIIELLKYYRSVAKNKAPIGSFTRAFIKDWGNGVLRNFLTFQSIIDGHVAFDIMPKAHGFEFILTRTKDNFSDEQVAEIDAMVEKFYKAFKEANDG